MAFDDTQFLDYLVIRLGMTITLAVTKYRWLCVYAILT